uniref:Platelet-derived growth factor (PDGF) family profile domain-containing protein n=1 Tax=Petromyzon marinus TaxID=7757 RepID=S4R9P2_PETMA
VVPLERVMERSACMPRETLVSVAAEYPGDTDIRYHPSCVAIMRCSGCCNDETRECLPTAKSNVTLEVFKLNVFHSGGKEQMSFAQHDSCKCGIERKLTKAINRRCTRGDGSDVWAASPVCRLLEPRQRPEYVTDHTAEGGKPPSSSGFKCSQCESRCRPCSGPRLQQDPDTCRCSCRMVCKHKLLLNKHTCKCEKPRR